MNLAQTIEVFLARTDAGAADDVLRARRGQWFDPALTDTNERLSNGTAQQVSQASSSLAGLDANADGMLSKTEYMSHYERQFDAMNKNTVGLVDLRRMQESATVAAERGDE